VARLLVDDDNSLSRDTAAFRLSDHDRPKPTLR